MRKVGSHKRVIDVEAKRYAATASRPVALNVQAWGLSARLAINSAGEPFPGDIPNLSRSA